MNASEFTDRSNCPANEDVADCLGETFDFWIELLSRTQSSYEPLIQEWTFAGKKYGWSLRLKWKKQTLMYMTPCSGYFRAAFAFGEKAVQTAIQNRLPEFLLKLIDEAPRFPEGRAVRLEVRAFEDVSYAIELLRTRMIAKDLRGRLESK
jgi:hypothetical protein